MLKRSYVANRYTACRSDSTDSQFTETEDELTFLEACMDCDEDALYDIIQDGVTWEQVNEKDKSGRTALSHACANGFMPILDLMAEVEEVDANCPDNDGNTPLIFAAQAGHDDVTNALLHHFRRVKIDHANKLGFTALMKAAIQGRTRCAKQLLFSGANPNRRDFGRGLCAEEWARFCGRQACAEAISKYIHSKKYFFKKTFLMSREKWKSEPDLIASAIKSRDSKDRGSWITRHLSMKRKKRGQGPGDEKSQTSPTIAETTRGGSAPELNFPSSPEPERRCVASMRRPSCFDNVVPVNIIPKLRRTNDVRNKKDITIPSIMEEHPKMEPPTILETDFDYDMERMEAG